MFKKRFDKYEYRYLKRIILLLDKEDWTTKDLEYVLEEFKKFVKNTGLDELDLLRKGEVMLGKYCEVDLSSMEDVKDLVYKCFNSIDEISSPVCLVIVTALCKLALNQQTQKD